MPREQHPVVACKIMEQRLGWLPGLADVGYIDGLAAARPTDMIRRTGGLTRVLA
jgi:hypothetical protein